MTRAAPDPLVSVVIAAYNGATLIRETIDSVRAQTMPDFEIVVVDDCSTDDTAAIVAGIADPRVRLVRAPRNGGPAVARTLGMVHAQGRFVAGLDQDDLCAPDRFARQLTFLDAHRDVALVTSTILSFGAGGDREDAYPDLVDPAEIDWTLQLVNPLAWSSVMMRGEAARSLVPFQRNEYRYAEDFDLYHRVRRYGRIGRIAAALVSYRQHAAGVSKTSEETMIRAAGRVLAGVWGSLFDDGGEGAGLLLSRHAGASHAPPDIATLAACGRVLERLVAERGHLAPDFAAASASGHWWRIARTGLRAGAYSAARARAVRPAFIRDDRAVRRRFAGDTMVGAARRLAAFCML
jgi:GT2 family glycosyltransferase